MAEIIERPLTPEEIAEQQAFEAATLQREIESTTILRRVAYQNESDPIFFQVQRGEGTYTNQDWLDKISEINTRYPYPATPKK